MVGRSRQSFDEQKVILSIDLLSSLEIVFTITPSLVIS